MGLRSDMDLGVVGANDYDPKSSSSFKSAINVVTTTKGAIDVDKCKMFLYCSNCSLKFCRPAR
jgi:hypothetical protein